MVAHVRKKQRARCLQKRARQKGVPLDAVDETHFSTSVEHKLNDFDFETLSDKRLELMFVCAHPAIDASIRTPLMLQTVLGIEAKDIASAMLMPVSALAQRLVRAKRKIKSAKISFVLPTTKDMPKRLPAVLEAVYGAYSIDWLGEQNFEMAKEALFLSHLLVEQMPKSAEVLGLHALLLFCIAREDARFVDDVFVPLSEQDVGLYDKALSARADKILARALALNDPGRFQLEAAIQSAHEERPQNWAVIASLYEGLVTFAPSAGAHVARAMAIAKVKGPAFGLAILESIPEKMRKGFQAYWVARAHLEQSQNQSGQASMKRAISLTTSAKVRTHLEKVMTAWQ